MSLLEVKNLVSGYGKMTILDGVTFDVPSGDLVGMIGPNGAGKTTTLESIVGIVKPKKGEVLFKGNDVTNLNAENKMRRYKIAYIPEENGIFPEHTVKENLEVSLSSASVSKGEWAEKIEGVGNILPRLEERLNQRAGTMSGGEQKMLYLANGIVREPELMVVDEISSGLQPNLVDELFGVLKRINQEERVTMLMVGQNANKLMGISDYTYILEEGKVKKEGKSSNLLEDENVIDAYLGTI